MRETVPTEQARQGEAGRRVFYVLAASLVLGGLFLGGMSLWVWNKDTDSARPQAGVEMSGNTPSG